MPFLTFSAQLQIAFGRTPNHDPFALESSFTLSSTDVRASVTEALKLMSDDTHDDMINLDDPSEYEDPVSQRAMAFCHVAKLADTVQNEAIKELCLTMLRKLNASIRTPSTADLRSIEGGHK